MSDNKIKENLEVIGEYIFCCWVLEPSQTTKIEHFVEIVNRFEPLTFLWKTPSKMFDPGSEYNSSSVSQLM